MLIYPYYENHYGLILAGLQQSTLASVVPMLSAFDLDETISQLLFGSFERNFWVALYGNIDLRMNYWQIKQQWREGGGSNKQKKARRKRKFHLGSTNQE